MAVYVPNNVMLPGLTVQETGLTPEEIARMKAQIANAQQGTATPVTEPPLLPETDVYARQRENFAPAPVPSSVEDAAPSRSAARKPSAPRPKTSGSRSRSRYAAPGTEEGGASFTPMPSFDFSGITEPVTSAFKAADDWGTRNADTLLALGQGLLSSRDWAQGLSAGIGEVRSMREKNKTYEALIKKGVPPEEAKAAASNPNYLKALLMTLYPKPGAAGAGAAAAAGKTPILRSVELQPDKDGNPHHVGVFSDGSKKDLGLAYEAGKVVSDGSGNWMLFTRDPTGKPTLRPLGPGEGAPPGDLSAAPSTPPQTPDSLPQPTTPPTGPQPTTSQPTAPQPTAPQPTAPQPTAPQPTAPQPTAPQPTAPQPVPPPTQEPQTFRMPGVSTPAFTEEDRSVVTTRPPSPVSNLGGLQPPPTQPTVDPSIPGAAKREEAVSHNLKAQRDLTEAQNAYVEKHAKDANRAATIWEDMTDIEDLTEKLLKSPALGVQSGPLSYLPNVTQSSVDYITDRDNLNAKLTTGNMKKMKEESATGATGFGSLNQSELHVLETVTADLKRPGQSPEGLRSQYQKVLDLAKRYKARLMREWKAKYPNEPFPGEDASSKKDGIYELEDGRLVVKKGGQTKLLTNEEAAQVKAQIGSRRR